MYALETMDRMNAAAIDDYFARIDKNADDLAVKCGCEPCSCGSDDDNPCVCEPSRYDEGDDFLTDNEADGMTLASCGWGTDEDYGYYESCDYE